MGGVGGKKYLIKCRNKIMSRKSSLLKKVSTFFNKTSRRPNAYASGYTPKRRRSSNKVAPIPREKKKESLSEFDKRRDHESTKDPKGKDGWRTKEHKMIKSTC